MRQDLADIICCPVHKSRLTVTVANRDEHGDVLSGTLRCNACKFDYPIDEGIPNLLPPEMHVDEVKTRTAKNKAGRQT